MTDEVINDNSPIDDSVFESDVLDRVESAKVEGPVVEDRGYKTYDQWVKDGRDPEEYKGRKAYEKEGERFKALMTLQAEQKAQREAMSKMWEHNKRIEENAKKTALEELKLQAMQATSIGDVTRVGEITDKIVKMNETRTDYEPMPQAQPAAGEDARDIFSRTNPWYKNPQNETDYAKIGYAERVSDEVAAEYHSRGQKLPMEQHLQIVSERVAQRFNTQPVRRQEVITGTGETSGNTNEARTLMDSLPQFHKNMIYALKKANKNFSTADLKRYISQL